MLCFITDIQFVSMAGPLAEKLEENDEECGRQQDGIKQHNSRAEGDSEPWDVQMFYWCISEMSAKSEGEVSDYSDTILLLLI